MIHFNEKYDILLFFEPRAAFGAEDSGWKISIVNLTKFEEIVWIEFKYNEILVSLDV